MMTVRAAGYIHSLLSIVVLFIASVVVVVWGGEENSMGEKLYVWERENHMCCGNLGEGGGALMGSARGLRCIVSVCALSYH